MRLWSLHPRYLDPQGLTACWREGLLARKVLSGQTKGYKSHPQLIRFRSLPDPIRAIDAYLVEIHTEATRRGYNYDGTKIGPVDFPVRISVTTGQLEFEAEHLKKKLIRRSPERIAALGVKCPEPHPIFSVTEGEIENWEIL